MKIRKILVALVGTFVCTAASAQGYLSLSAGVTDLDETNIQVSPGSIKTDYGDGTSFRAAYGYNFTSFRGEIELAKYENNVDSHSLNGASLTGPTGEASALALMFNGYFDFETGSNFTPYVGLGVGNVELDFSSFGVRDIPRVLEADDSVIGYQFMLGGNYELSERTSLFGEYRILSADESTVRTSFETGGVETGIDYEVSVLQFGVNLRF